MFTEPGSHESSRDFRIGSRRERLRPKSKLPSTRRPSLPSSNTPNRWRAAGLYGGGGEGLLYRLLPRPDLHPNPPHRRLDQRLCWLRRWADEPSAEVAPRYFQRGHIFQEECVKKSPAYMRGFLLLTTVAIHSWPIYCRSAWIARGWSKRVSSSISGPVCNTACADSACEGTRDGTSNMHSASCNRE